MSFSISPKTTIAALLFAVFATMYCLHAQWEKVRPVDRESAVGRLDQLSLEERTAFGFASDFEVKRAPESGDWLAAHAESGQSYSQYLSSGANTPCDTRKVIYILPLGEFKSGEAPKLSDLEQYTEAYFHPLEVKFLPAVKANEVKAKLRDSKGVLQWKSTDIIQWLPSRLPKDAYAMIGVTMTDLYPEEAWNFVFGQASLNQRVGVFSFARYDPAFYGQEKVADREQLVLVRSSKVLSHELGHMFGIKHCIYYQCNMNGANNLNEADASPMHLCPVCHRKLHRACGFSPKERYQSLLQFYQQHGLDDEADFVKKRIERMQ